MDNQRINRRRRNLPAELKVEIVDCLPLENAVHFLANVPNRLIIHHCAPRIRRILKKIDKIVFGYALTTAPNHIWIKYGHKYTPEMDIFLRYGDAHSHTFYIRRSTIDNGFVGYPADFFDDLIKHYYETKVPAKAVRHLEINLPLTNPSPWPTTLVQPREMKLNELEVDNDGKWALYILRNKYNPGIAFDLYIFFEGDAKYYQQMTRFIVYAWFCLGPVVEDGFDGQL